MRRLIYLGLALLAGCDGITSYQQGYREGVREARRVKAEGCVPDEELPNILLFDMPGKPWRWSDGLRDGFRDESIRLIELAGGKCPTHLTAP